MLFQLGFDNWKETCNIRSRFAKKWLLWFWEQSLWMMLMNTMS